MAPVDYLFIDGHHDRDATIRYFRDAATHLADHAVVIFDDISWNDGMREAWRTIRQDHNICTSVDLGPMGIVVFSEGHGGGQEFNFPL